MEIPRDDTQLMKPFRVKALWQRTARLFKEGGEAAEMASSAVRGRSFVGWGAAGRKHVRIASSALVGE